MRYALIRSGIVVNVIEATPEFFARADPAWLARWDRVVRYADPGRPDAEAEVVSAQIEPGATVAPDGTVTRAARPAEPPTIEERLAALEARGR